MDDSIIKCSANWKHVTVFQFNFQAEKARDSDLISLREGLGIELLQSSPSDLKRLKEQLL